MCSPALLLRYRLFLLLPLGGVGPILAKEVQHASAWTLTIWGTAAGLPSNVVRGLAHRAAARLGPPDGVTSLLPHRFHEATRFHGLLVAIAGVVVLGLLLTEFRVIRAQRRALEAERSKRLAEEEARVQRDQLARIARAASLGELSTSIAHEVNQPLAAIISNARAASRMLDAPSPDLPEIHAALDDIVTGGNLAAGVIARVRALIAKQQVSVQPVDLNQIICDVIELVAPEMKRRGVAVRPQLTADLPPAKGDPIELQQVMLNLLVNGAQAMVDVEPESRVLEVRSAVNKGELLVSVADHGVGLDDETKEKIFEPFFTTRTSGVGMGLSINRSIIEFRGGRLWATQNRDCGATFHFSIPVFALPAESKELNQEQTL